MYFLVIEVGMAVLVGRGGEEEGWGRRGAEWGVIGLSEASRLHVTLHRKEPHACTNTHTHMHARRHIRIRIRIGFIAK